MRKRIVIGALVVIAVGVLVYVRSQLNEKSVEWHRRKFREIDRVIYGEPLTFGDRVGFLWRNLWGKPRDYHGEADRHIRALIELGYAEERTFVVSNRPISEIGRVEWARGRNFEILRIGRGINTLTIRAAKEDMVAIERLIHEADVPERRK